MMLNASAVAIALRALYIALVRALALLPPAARSCHLKLTWHSMG